MNIAFWSNVRHRSGVTSSVALLSVLWVELFEEEVAVTSNHICNFGLVNRLSGGNEFEEKTEKNAYRYVLGEPEYYRLLYGGEIKTILWLNGKLKFVPMEVELAELFDVRDVRTVNNGVEEMTCLMIDLACGFGECSRKILNEADVPVIVFPACRESVDAFLQSEITIRERGFFVLGMDRADPFCRPSYLTKHYKIPKERIGVIPYEQGFEQAMRDGSLISYITRNLRCSKRSRAYRLLHCAVRTVNRLRAYAIYERSRGCGDCGEE